MLFIQNEICDEVLHDPGKHSRKKDQQKSQERDRAIARRNLRTGTWVRIEEICNGEWSIGGPRPTLRVTTRRNS